MMSGTLGSRQGIRAYSLVVTKEWIQLLTAGNGWLLLLLLMLTSTAYGVYFATRKPPRVWVELFLPSVRLANNERNEGHLNFTSPDLKAECP